MTRPKKKQVIIYTDNPAAVSCGCVICKFKEAMAEAMAIKIDKEIMKGK